MRNHWKEMRRQSSHFWMQMLAAVFYTIIGAELAMAGVMLGVLFVGIGFFQLFMAREEFNSPQRGA